MWPGPRLRRIPDVDVNEEKGRVFPASEGLKGLKKPEGKRSHQCCFIQVIQVSRMVHKAYICITLSQLESVT
ncbi:MAG: hypothetical protein AN484_26725 [Aphanizomenon flos-aquae WA102]|uniref:Uncharacterized protein n=1 Tax=Aphanizomenon flos-aquae WA102 TaxID=1710896 RepID=A0A1B7WB61_APHFL|nr:MAG: hypothetical protein AN484_26725 [Aphanizomenon flos-aquae WA102]